MKAAATAAFLLFLFTASCTSVEEHKVIIDPGHGGANITIKGQIIKSERWDPVTNKYISYYLTGAESGRYKEYLLVLDLAKRVRYYLDLTQTLWGWQKFANLLQKFSEQDHFDRIILRAKLTRQDSWDQHYNKADKLSVNNKYRMYDYPDQRGRIRRGRISFINHYKPSLVVSLHMTPAGRGNEGGMAAVLSPGFKSYNLIRQIHLNQKSIRKWKKSFWKGKVLKTESAWSQYQLMRADSWVYFHGYRTNRSGTQPNYKAARGIRHNLISWAYKEDEHWEKDYKPNEAGPYALSYKDFRPQGKFWDRERSQEEEWRREGGRLGYGGDNHYASDELLRFVQYGVRLLSPKMQLKKKIGKIHFPFVSSYTLPIYVNAVTAFLEIGYLNRERDRALIMKKREAVAQSLAVGIYSLYSGISLRPLLKNPYTPQSKPLNFEKYKNYFESAVN